MSKWYTVNETGFKKIQELICSKAKRFQYIEGWINDAEHQFSLEGQCVLELAAWQSLSGQTESLVLTENDFYPPWELA
jgi:hypothetical protein